MAKEYNYEELEGSELGTKEYWDEQYETEIENFRANGDIGDIWFGEDSVERILKWILQKQIPSTSNIIDIGCGNGMILISLAQENFSNLFGVDYSNAAIQLAKEVAKKQNLTINYQVCDILEDNTDLCKKFDIAHDKGTYDAISLHPDDPKEKRNKYIRNISKILKDGGLLVITSCNWTKEELLEQFQEYFTLFDVIPTPQFKFGNKVGSVVTSIVFKKCF